MTNIMTVLFKKKKRTSGCGGEKTLKEQRTGTKLLQKGIIDVS